MGDMPLRRQFQELPEHCCRLQNAGQDHVTREPRRYDAMSPDAPVATPPAAPASGLTEFAVLMEYAGLGTSRKEGAAEVTWWDESPSLCMWKAGSFLEGLSNMMAMSAVMRTL